MLKCKIQLVGALFLACLSLAGAAKYQVSYIAGAPDEPKLRKHLTVEATAELLATRLSQTFKQEVKAVPFDKADAETIFLITREKIAGGEYEKILEGQNGDSFIIRYPVTFKGKKNVCLLMNRDGHGYCYPGNYFLREFLGVDMVFPTDYGYIIPDNSKWKMPAKIDVKQIPDFNTRTWTMNTVINKEFARMNLAESRRTISWHTFGRIVSPQKYGKKHPEYFPLVKGKRYNNPRKERCDWSPCVSNPEVQKLFVDYLVRNYGAGGSEAVELSVNDGSGRHCECPGCIAWDNPVEKARGFYSNRYFTFYKKVLDAAQKIQPRVKACILLYSDATTLVPTKVEIHPGLVGMSTKENTLRNFAKAGMKHMGLWEHQLDYLYPLPRHYPKAMKARLNEMYDIGVREYFGEVYMIAAANVPKQYILGRLLWDRKADPDKILKEFALKAYGPEAAPFMKKYYDTWEKVYEQECKARSGKGKARLMAYTVEWFAGVYPEDMKTFEECIAKAEKCKMTADQRKRYEVVKNHFSYIKQLLYSYLDCVAIRQGTHSVEEIYNTFQRCAARDKEFMKMWNEVISKDPMGLYSRVRPAQKRQKPNTVSGLYRNATKAYMHESLEVALRNHEKAKCAGMKKAAKLAYWNKYYKQFPTMLPLATLIGENAGTKLKNYIQNGNFKDGTPGNPEVKGDYPKLKHWYFYDQIGDVLADDYKNHWKLVKSKAVSNHMCFGEGKYPEMRQYMYLHAGVYRLSFRRLGVNTMSFNLYEVPTLTKEAFKDVMTLRSNRVRTPAVFSYNHLAAPGTHFVTQTVLVEKEGWHVLYIATPNHAPKSWDRIWNLKLEKLTP